MVATCLQYPVPLGTASTYAVLANTTVTNTGNTVLTGNLGIYPGTSSSITGFPPGTFTGTENAGNATAQTAQANATTAFDNAAVSDRGGCTPVTISSLSGTLTPGLYASGSSMAVTGTLTLSGLGVFVFQMPSSTLTTTTFNVVLANGAIAADIFWEVGSSA
ncbi:MAG: DUF3494 domain-containing protein, partial [Thermoplasmata archaeon]|nr:DUF3494 domain-containing protein [Thermoplasmata archaeon]